jgi:hypothetical protein
MIQGHRIRQVFQARRFLRVRLKYTQVKFLLMDHWNNNHQDALLSITQNADQYNLPNLTLTSVYRANIHKTSCDHSKGRGALCL